MIKSQYLCVSTINRIIQVTDDMMHKLYLLGYAVLSFLSSFALILLRKRELGALL